MRTALLCRLAFMAVSTTAGCYVQNPAPVAPGQPVTEPAPQPVDLSPPPPMPAPTDPEDPDDDGSNSASSVQVQSHTSIGSQTKMCYAFSLNGQSTGTKCFSDQPSYCASLCAETISLAVQSCQQRCSGAPSPGAI